MTTTRSCLAFFRSISFLGEFSMFASFLPRNKYFLLSLFFLSSFKKKLRNLSLKNNKTLLKEEALKLKRKLREEIKRNSPALVEGDFLTTKEKKSQKCRKASRNFLFIKLRPL